MRKIFVPDSTETKADAVVIGGGIVGVATAFWLSRAGLKTILLEMREGLSTLTTAASIESFRAQFTEPAMAALAGEAIGVWENFAQVTGLEGYDINLHHGGYLFFSGEESRVGDIKKTVEGYHACGVTDSEFWTGDEVRKNFPWASEKVKAGAYRAKDGWFSAHEATQGLAKASENALFYVKTRALDIETDAKGVKAVVTDRGAIQTRVVVNSAGPFAIQVGRMVGAGAAGLPGPAAEGLRGPPSRDPPGRAPDHRHRQRLLLAARDRRGPDGLARSGGAPDRPHGAAHRRLGLPGLHP